MKKKLFLLLLVVAEIGLGSIFLIKYFNHQQTQRQILGLAKIAKIDETKVIKNIDEELEHYWEYSPNELVADDPSWLENPIRYTINSDGLNDSQDYEVTKPNNTFRIIALGDSFTFGHYVETKDNWSEVLERMLADRSPSCGENLRFEVLNLGMPGFDVQELVRRYRRVGQKYNPDLVVWFESGSGFYRFNQIMQPLIKECEAMGQQRQSDSGNLERTISCLGSADEYVTEHYSDELKAELYKGYLVEFFTLIGQSKPIFVYLDQDKGLVGDYYNDLSGKFPEADFYFLNRDLSKKSTQLFDGHPNLEGHRLIADSIFEILTENNWLCR